MQHWIRNELHILRHCHARHPDTKDSLDRILDSYRFGLALLGHSTVVSYDADTPTPIGPSMGWNACVDALISIDENYFICTIPLIECADATYPSERMQMPWSLAECKLNENHVVIVFITISFTLFWWKMSSASDDNVYVSQLSLFVLVHLISDLRVRAYTHIHNQLTDHGIV